MGNWGRADLFPVLHLSLIASFFKGLQRTYHVPDAELGAGGFQWWVPPHRVPIKQWIGRGWGKWCEQQERTKLPLLSEEFRAAEGATSEVNRRKSFG